MTSVSEKVPEQLLYQRSPKLLSFLKERRPIRTYPLGSSTYSSGQVLEFQITSDTLVDLQTAVLNFDISFGTGGSQISNAVDVIESARVYYNDVMLEQVDQASAINNLFLAASASYTWCQSEGDAYLGLTSQYFQSSSNTARSYSVPLTLVMGLFRSASSFLPLVGNRLRLSFTLAKDAQVISKSSNASDTYTLSKLSLTYDEILVESRFRKSIMDAMMS